MTVTVLDERVTFWVIRAGADVFHTVGCRDAPDNLIDEFGTIVADELFRPAMLEEDLLGQRLANCQRFLVREAYRVVDSSGDVSDMAHVFEAINLNERSEEVNGKTLVMTAHQ